MPSAKLKAPVIHYRESSALVYRVKAELSVCLSVTPFFNMFFRIFSVNLSCCVYICEISVFIRAILLAYIYLYIYIYIYLASLHPKYFLKINFLWEKDWYTCFFLNFDLNQNYVKFIVCAFKNRF